jgi:hypothetical protein
LLILLVCGGMHFFMHGGHGGHGAHSHGGQERTGKGGNDER